MCYPVIEQHQFQGPDVPEFTISVVWQEGDMREYLAGKNSRAHGWRYVMHWDDNGKSRYVSGYGFATDKAARYAAEARATKIAKAQRPEKVYKFTPNMED